VRQGADDLVGTKGSLSPVQRVRVGGILIEIVRSSADLTSAEYISREISLARNGASTPSEADDRQAEFEASFKRDSERYGAEIQLSPA